MCLLCGASASAHARSARPKRPAATPRPPNRLLTYAAPPRRKYLPLLHRNWLFWLPTQTVFFAVLAPEFLVPITCMAGVVWNVILSSLAYRGVRVPAAAAAAAELATSEPGNAPAATAADVAGGEGQTMHDAPQRLTAAVVPTAEAVAPIADATGGEGPAVQDAPQRLSVAHSAALCVMIRRVRPSHMRC